MSLSLGIATYFVIWWVALFAVLPFGVQSQRELNDIVPGTEPGAPARPRILMRVAANTVLSGLIFAVVDVLYIIYVNPH
jgi:predicted secreted protein